MKLFAVCLITLFFAAWTPAQEVWQPRVSGVTNNLWAVAYAANQWVAVGEQGTILTSPDGAVWTTRASGFPSRWLVSVGYGAGTWIVVGEGGLILTSTDAVTWTLRKNGGTRINAVAYGNGTFVAADDVGSTYYSVDAVTWSGPFFARSGFARGLVYGAPYFVTTGLTGIQTTYDGSSSTTRLSGTPQLQGAAYGRRLYLATGGANTYTSRDAVTWTLQPPTTNVGVQGATFFNNQFVAVGNGGGITTTFDGSAWTDRASGTTQTLIAVGASPDSAVVVGFGGTILQALPAQNPPAIATAPVAVTEAIGGNVVFSVTARGSSPLSYQWSKDGTPIADATSDIFFLPGISAANAGNYTCTVTNPYGSATSAAAPLTVLTTFPAADPVDATFALNPAINKGPRAMLAQADGKILLGGDFLVLNNGQAQFGLARVSANGALDGGFAPGSLDPNGFVQALAVQPDGKILIGGSFISVNGATRRNLARLNADGSLDNSFSSGADPAFAVRQILVTSDLKILVANGDNRLTRLNSDGSLDATFTRTIFTVGSLNAAIAYTDLQLDGKIVVAGTAFNNGPNGAVRRFAADGTVDASFAPIVLNNQTDIRALRVLTDGRIMVGTSTSTNPLGFSVYAFTVSGLSDPSFAFFNSSSTSGPTLAFTPEGRTWISGNFNQLGGVGRAQLARLNLDGSLDLTFNPGSGLKTGALITTTASLIVPVDNGRALIAGDFATVNGTARPFVSRLNSQSNGGANLAVGIATEPAYIAVRAGESFSVKVSAAGSAQITYGATFPNGSVGGTTPVLTFTNPQTSGAYAPSVVNSVGGTPVPPVYVRVLPAAPQITAEPSALQTNTGRTIALTVGSIGSDPRTYQWFKNGSAISGANTATYLAPPNVTSTGEYTVVIRNTLGFATSQTVHVGVDETARFINLATRGNVGKSDALLIVGFVIQGPGTKRVMLRATGPALAQFGVTGVLADPILRVFNGSGSQIYTNDDWAAANDVAGIASAPARLGAFPLPTGSTDAAGILTLNPGSYTAVISGKPNGTVETTGIALAEIYEDDITSSARLVNLSSRGVVSPGASVMIPAFVTSTTGTQTPKKFLIRGVGPALTQFGVTGALANPIVTVTNSAGATVASNDDWETNTNVDELRTITSQLAFPLPTGSKDAALLVSLPPGGYTIQVSGVASTSGTALVEVYEVQ